MWFACVIAFGCMTGMTLMGIRLTVLMDLGIGVGVALITYGIFYKPETS